MVNTDFEKFKKVQQEHKVEYLGGSRKKPGINDPEYNNQENTDKSPGTTGRDI
ncbi:MAG: hypothetical protein K6T88_07120 [Bacillus sp. (in: Bacteria)]|nr:hypothetical protein [Bacillus sp. (in: firmicutes)]